ncbi:MAG: hypothetical protein IJC72_00210 [Clostridia bacterium]|nr:hypothetical protein [Clostridia bacterium]
MAKEQKKKVLGIFAVILCLCAGALATYLVLNNQNEKPEHTHEYSAEYKRDEVNHWFECECGEKSEVENHTFVDGVCICGYEEGHVHNFNETKSDANNHWSECECGEKDQVESHTFVGNKCECGYEKEEEGGNPVNPETPTPPTHSHNYESKFNETHHWKECACGDKTELIAHSGGKASCINKAECLTCGQQYGEIGNHSYGDWMSNGNGTHTKTCGNDNSHKITESCIDNGNKVCVFCGASIETYSRVEDKIYFGSYPQTEVTDNAFKSTLNNLAGELPTASNNRNWTSYGYYIEGKEENFMWYIDVTTGGKKYRGVYFTSYRPCWATDVSSSSDNTFQDENGYYTNTIYWFEYEPIEWRILSESAGKALLMSNLVLDSQAYQNKCYKSGYHYCTDSNGAPLYTYASNYKYSTMRNWLNDNFYNTAFDRIEKEIINIVLVDNSASSMMVTESKFACESTYDNIFLLSLREITTTAYGFDDDTFANDVSKQLKTTDYSRCQGYDIYSRNYGRRGFWWLRTPTSFGDEVKAVGGDGRVNYARFMDYTAFGVVPAIQIKLN